MSRAVPFDPLNFLGTYNNYDLDLDYLCLFIYPVYFVLEPFRVLKDSGTDNNFDGYFYGTNA